MRKKRMTRYKTKYIKRYGGNYYPKSSIRKLSRRWARAERRARVACSKCDII